MKNRTDWTRLEAYMTGNLGRLENLERMRDRLRQNPPEQRKLLGYVMRALPGIGMHRVAIYEGMKVFPHETLEEV